MPHLSFIVTRVLGIALVLGSQFSFGKLVHHEEIFALKSDDLLDRRSPAKSLCECVLHVIVFLRSRLQLDFNELLLVHLVELCPMVRILHILS